MPKAITASTSNSVGMLTSSVASPSRSLRAASAMAQAPISGNAMIWTGVFEGGEAAEIEAVPHHRGHVVQPVHQHQRAQRHDRVTQPADGGQRQRRQRQQGMARDIRLDDRAAEAGAWNFRHVAEQRRRMRSPSKASMAATMIRSRYSPSRRGARIGTGVRQTLSWRSSLRAQSVQGSSEISGLSEERPGTVQSAIGGRNWPRVRPHLAGKQNLPFVRKMLRTGLSPRRRSGRRRLQPEIMP